MLEQLREILSSQVFIDDDFVKLKIWFYKANTLVVDIIWENYNFAYDFIVYGSRINITLLSRNNATKKLLEQKGYKERSNLGLFLIKDIPLVIQNTNNQILVIEKMCYPFKVSVVIPVYNRASLIQECIKSLNRQTLSKKDFEVIFIDDCSSDETVAVIKASMDFDVNYRVMEREVNSGGASAPRNDGILAAQGKYVFFLDSDDYIIDSALENMINFAEKNNTDILYIKYATTDRQTPVRAYKATVDDAYLTENNLFFSIAPHKMIKKEFLITNKVFFPLGVKRGEDAIFIVKALVKSTKNSVLADQGYYHLVRHDEGHLYDKRKVGEEIYVASECISAIYSSDLDDTNKINFLSVFLKRILSTLISTFRYKKYGWDKVEQETWFHFVRKFYYLFLYNYNPNYLNLEMKVILKYILDNDICQLRNYYSIIERVNEYQVELKDGNFLVNENNNVYDVTHLGNFNFSIVSIEKVYDNTVRFKFSYNFRPFNLNNFEFILYFSDAKNREIDIKFTNYKVKDDLVEFNITIDAFNEFLLKKWHINFGIDMSSESNQAMISKKLRYYEGFNNFNFDKVEFYNTKNNYIAARINN